MALGLSSSAAGLSGLAGLAGLSGAAVGLSRSRGPAVGLSGAAVGLSGAAVARHITSLALIVNASAVRHNLPMVNAAAGIRRVTTLKEALS